MKKKMFNSDVINIFVGVVVGLEFRNILNSFRNNIINPLIAIITGGVGEDGIQTGGAIRIKGVSVNYGVFLSEVINFLIVAFVLFCVLKAINKAISICKKTEEAPKEDPEDIKLLREMVAIIKEQNTEATKRAEEKLAQS